MFQKRGIRAELRELRERQSSLERKVERMAVTVEEVQAAITALQGDLEGLAASAQAEFAKLEKEVSEGKPAELAPLKDAIEAIDTKVKAAVVPTD